MSITDGKHGDCQNQAGSGFYFLSCKDIHDGRLNWDSAREITAADFTEAHRRTRLEPSDIVITNSGTIGRMAIVPCSDEVRRTTFQKSVAILKPRKDLVDARYLLYRLQFDMPRLASFAGGTAQKNLLLRDLRAFPINLPSLPIQRKVSAILSAYDDLIENNNHRIKLRAEMSQRIYHEWFIDFRYPGHESVPLVDSKLGPIPRGWDWKHLRDIATELRISVDPGAIDPDTPYVGLEHMPERSIALSEWGTARSAGSRKLKFVAGDVLFGKIRPYFHKVSVAPVDGICSTDAVVVRSRTPDVYGVMVSVISSDAFVAEAVQSSQGTKMPRANWGVLEKYPVAIPPQALLEHFNAFAIDTVSLIHRMVKANRNLRSTRDLLLPRLISGDVDVTELDIAVPEAAA